ncbi:MAG: CheR family methyltransferase [Bacteroidota bacterium]|nr:CheR family methyltransferase [Bacteroidota bacterium]
MITDTIQNITDEELDSINQALTSRYGVDFTGYESSSIKRRITRIIHKYNLVDVMGLWKRLLYDHAFVIQFKDEISVGLTEMFRNPELWIYLRDKYLPTIAHKSNISVLHAGCSTGEEYYTMAILMHELNLLSKTSFHVIDLSDRFVEATQLGVYENDLLNQYNKNYLEFNPGSDLHFYFTKTSNGYKANDFLKQNVSFYASNLVSDTLFESFDIIFCRNVMIYFNDPLKMKVLEKFSRYLNNKGVLIIGYYDAMPSAYDKYFDYYDPSFKIFKPLNSK